MARQNVAVLGATGNIGTEFIRQVAVNDAPYLGKHANPTNVVGMANSDGFLFEPEGVEIQNDPELILELQNESRTAFKEWLRQQEGFGAGESLDDLFVAIENQGLADDVVFVDLTAGDLKYFHNRVITGWGDGAGEGKIVTANKRPVSECSFEVFKLLTARRDKYGYSCSVMAGAGAVPFLQDAFDTGDEVKSIEGCFSGTLGKLCNLLHKGDLTFSEAIKQLKVSGDTEPDPRDDLSGMDVAKKLVILARTAGYEIDLDDVKVEPFISGGFGKLAECDVEEFMAGADGFNDEMSGKFSSAKKNGGILRYVAGLKLDGEKPVLEIGLREVGLDSPLGNLKGNANKIVVYTDVYGDTPYELSAPGSGIKVTAGNIRRDLLQLLEKRMM